MSLYSPFNLSLATHCQLLLIGSCSRWCLINGSCTALSIHGVLLSVVRVVQFDSSLTASERRIRNLRHNSIYVIVLVEQELLSLPEHLSSPSVFSGVRVTGSLVFCVMFCRSLLVPFSFFFWPLCCLSFFDLRLLITLLVPSNLFFYFLA